MKGLMMLGLNLVIIALVAVLKQTRAYKASPTSYSVNTYHQAICNRGGAHQVERGPLLKKLCAGVSSLTNCNRSQLVVWMWMRLWKVMCALIDNLVRGGGDCVVLSCATRGEQGTGEIPPRFSSHNNALSSICGVLWGYCVCIKMI